MFQFSVNEYECVQNQKSLMNAGHWFEYPQSVLLKRSDVQLLSVLSKEIGSLIQ